MPCASTRQGCRTPSGVFSSTRGLTAPTPRSSSPSTSSSLAGWLLRSWAWCMYRKLYSKGVEGVVWLALCAMGSWSFDYEWNNRRSLLMPRVRPRLGVQYFPALTFRESACTWCFPPAGLPAAFRKRTQFGISIWNHSSSRALVAEQNQDTDWSTTMGRSTYEPGNWVIETSWLFPSASRLFTDLKGTFQIRESRVYYCAASCTGL